MIKVLFLIHDLGQGGAEKVLVNLVNNMDKTKFDVTVISLFGGGVNEQFLCKEVKYHTVFKKAFPANSKIMKLFSPSFLHKFCIKERYDIEVSYLEGPSARIVSGCPNKDTKLVSWIHCTMKSAEDVAYSFRNIKEANLCYDRFHYSAFVSNGVREAFLKHCEYSGDTGVLYNTIESDIIRKKSCDKAEGLDDKTTKLISVGSLKQVKGYDRLLRIVKRLKSDGEKFHLYILGIGDQESELENYIDKNNLSDVVTLLGYDTNPYKYIAQCDLYVCSSYSEGFSTAATEALIVGTPVVTVDVSGMKEMLGENNEYGIVTDNNEDALYEGIKKMLTTPGMLEDYAARAKERGKYFSTENTTKAVEEMLISL
ncbi:MAG: glycosyltransferase [Clostridia bacterium]|nr:glycosyltransferase [Clostridia bacterium]